jgi:hypothetical protein
MSKVQNAKRAEDPQSFMQFLAKIDGGAIESMGSEMLQEISVDLYEIAKAKHGKVRGTLTLKLYFETQPTGIVQITPKMTKTTPAVPTEPAVRFVTDNGILVESNPKQLAMKLRGIDGAAARNPMEDEGTND